MSGKWLAKDWTTGVKSPAGIVHHCAQTGFEVHPASYSISTGSAFPVGKADKAKVTLTFAFCRRYKRVELYNHFILKLHGLVIKHRGRFYSYCT
jgi:hypothetical protein